VTFQKARFDLARLRLFGGDALDRAMARAAEVSARTIGVRRVGVWTFDLEHDVMRCLHLYDEVSGHSTPGDTLSLSAYAPYASELERVRTIVADDARAHPATACLSEAYLVPLGIGAMLDAPVYRGGEVVGVVCHEHFGGPRQWSEREVDFAGSVADMLSSFAEQATRLEMLAALRERQKLETLGRVAAGVAHDFQNLLSVVLIHASRIQGHPSDAAIARDSSEEIRDAAQEGVALTKRLQALADPRGSRPMPVSVGEVAERMEPILRLLARGAARLEVRRETGADEVFADPSELEAVLLGLVTSARDGLIEHGGALSVLVRAARDGEAPNGASCVALEVRDDGVRPSAQEPRTDPRLTTKLIDAAGISLSTVSEIVSRARGSVQVASSPGEGATFTVLWPLVS
jgi:signal transduction histidine kinase